MAVDIDITPLPVKQIGGRLQALLLLPDPGAVPPTVLDRATIYIDPADGDLKIKFADGVIKTIVTDV